MVHTDAYVQRVAAARKPPSRDLTADDWIQAAFVAWGNGGYRALGVEPLAEQLGVTKGSFYWHFKSRSHLIERTLALWELRGCDEVILQLEKTSAPEEKLRQLFRQAWDTLDHLRAEAAIGVAAATGDPLVQPVQQRVQQKRLAYITKIYRELGCPSARATRLAIASYSAFLGSLQLIATGQPQLATARDLEKQVCVFEELLLAPVFSTSAHRSRPSR